MTSKRRRAVRLAAFVVAGVLVVGGAAACGGDDDSASDDTATTTTEAPPATEAPPPATEAPPAADTSDPDLTDLSSEEVVVLNQAREDYIVGCVAETAETDQERCALIWNCAVNEVGVAVAADAAQQGTLDEALARCSESVP